MTLRPGTVFAGYTIERLLGSGGMGSVYLARHPRLPRFDALKLLDAELGATPAFRVRFEREADVAARLNHPNVVAVHDRGVEQDRLWIAMQYVDGTDVAALIEHSALPLRRVVAIIDDAAKGLDHAHRFGLLHRDVKPANILVAAAPDEPGGERALITDFGIARALDDTQQFTQTGDILATIAYAAPEQLEGRSVDHRADVYALGCTLFEMLTGHKPFPRDNAVAVMQAHLSSPPPRPTDSVPSLPPAIDGVVARALAKRPADRFDNCRVLADAATTALLGGPSQHTPSAMTRTSGPDAYGPTQSGPVRSGPVQSGPIRSGPVPSAPVPAATVLRHEPAPKRRGPLIAGIAVAVLAVAVVIGVVVVRGSGSDSSTSATGTTTPVTTEQTTTTDEPTTTTRTTAAPNGYTAGSTVVRGSTDNATYDVELPTLNGGDPAVTAEFNESMRSALQDQIDGSPGQRFTLSGGDSTIAHIGEHVVSGLLLTSWNADPPGAHPSALVATIVVNTDTGQPITLDDLFADTSAGLERLSEQAALLLPDTAAGPNYSPSGITPEVANFANWIPTPDGMEIHFTDGQVGPHAAGLVVVTVPWTALEDVLSPGMAAIVSS